MNWIKLTIASFLVLATLGLTAQSNSYEIINVSLKEWENDSKYLSVEGKGRFENYRYPKVSVYINDELVNEPTTLYGVILDEEKTFEVALEQLPQAFMAKIVVQESYNDVKPVIFLYEHVDPNAKKEVYPIRQIDFVKKGEYQFLKIDFEPFVDQEFWSYPTFKIEMNGKVIAERGLSSYGLVQTELVPTTLDKLPDNFKCTITLGQHGSDKVLKMEYVTD